MEHPTRDEPWPGRLTRAELLRKTLHMGVGLLAFALAELGLVGSALLLGALSVFNLWLWPRLGGRRLWRSDQSRFDIGIALYPTVLLALLVLFRRLDLLAAIWGILAFGDGTATLVGRLWGASRRLPWNPHKSWPGLLAHFLCGSLGALVLLVWTTHRLADSRPFLASPTGLEAELVLLWVGGALAAALTAALVESLPQGLDDNLLAPPIAALVLWGWLETGPFWATLLDGSDPARAPLLGQLALGTGVGLVVNSVLAALAWRAGSIDRSGVMAGIGLGTLIFAFAGAAGFSLLVAFFVLGSATTRIGWAVKEARGMAQDNRGRRGARNALANVGVPAVLSFFAFATPHPEALRLAFAAAFATAAADTVSSELGQLWGRRPVLLTTLRRVRPGIDGAISLPGTLAGIAASGIIAVLAWIVGLCSPLGMAWIVLAALAGNLFDSLLGATLENRDLLDNEAVNFLATLGGALVGLGLAGL